MSKRTANVSDPSSIKETLDKNVKEIFSNKGFVQDNSLNNYQILIGIICIVSTLSAYYYKNKALLVSLMIM
jgi:hypothetical protein